MKPSTLIERHPIGMGPLKSLCTFIIVSLSYPLLAQMQTAEGPRFGNEWIDFDQSYLKLKVVEDGVYRISAKTMFEHGMPTDLNGSQISMYWLGEEQYIYTSNSGALTDTDYIEFYGEKNRAQVDQYLWDDPDNQMLNPDYSLHSDTSIYFLTWRETSSDRRYELRTNVESGASLRTSYLEVEKADVHTHHFKPQLNTQGVRYSTYLTAEGFSTAQKISHKLALSTSEVAVASTAIVRFRVTGNSRDHALDVTWNGTNKLSIFFQGSKLIDTSFEISTAEIQSANSLEFTTAGGSDRIVVSTYSIEYERSINVDVITDGPLIFTEALQGYAFQLSATAQDQYRVLDRDRQEIVIGSFSAGTSRFDFPAGPSRDRIHLYAQEDVIPITSLEKVEWIDFSTSSTEYLMITTQALDPAGTDDAMDEYLRYRSSAEGGSFDVRIVYSEQLQDQFAYGIHQHPLSIKNFINYIDTRWENLEYLVLVGKGLEYQRNRDATSTQDLLPVYGLPGSDVLMTSKGLSSTVPLVPMGRIAVKTVEQLSTYLTKVQVMERQLKSASADLESESWKKKVLHLSAGTGENEQRILASSLQGMGDIVADNAFAADVISITKQSSGTFDESLTSQVLDIIKDGLIIKTYFGHGGVTTTQYQSIEDPRFLENFERYPLMISLGCHTGDVFTTATSLSESNVLSTDKGAMAYLGTSGLGFLSSLNSFGRRFYGFLDPVPTISLGKLVRESLMANSGTSIGTITLNQQLTFHGDPALQLSYRTTPDYTIDRSTIKIPSIVPINEVEVELQYSLFNLGVERSDTVLVQIDHLGPTGSVFQTIVDTLKNVGYSQESTLAISITDPSLEGRNHLRFTVDPLDLIEELPLPVGESNNNVIVGGIEGVEFTIVSNSVVPCWPPRFGKILSSDQLIAIGNHLEDDVTAILQIDTTPDFDSPSFIEVEKTQKSGLFYWDLPSTLVENQVYFWRTRDLQQLDSWSTSSFVIALEDRGWYQGHRAQIFSNNLVTTDTFKNALAFGLLPWEIQVITKIVPSAGQPLAGLSRNNILYGSSLFWNSIDEGLVVYHHNVQDRQVKFNPPGGDFGTTSKQSVRTSHFSFETQNQDGRLAFINFINNEIPDGHFVYVISALRTTNSTLYGSDWQSDSTTTGGETIFTTLEKHGATQVRSLQENDIPYLFAFVKGERVLDEQVGGRDDIVSTIVSVPARVGQGSLRSNIIGPAVAWSDVNFALTADPNDDVELALYGRKSTAVNSERELLESLVSSAGSIDISSVETDRFPYIELEIVLSDTVDYDPAQIDLLDVSYVAPADLSIDGSAGLEYNDSLLLGQPISIKVPIRNLGQLRSDSTEATFTIRDNLNNSQVSSIPVPPLEPGELYILEASLSLEGIVTSGTVNVQINGSESFPELTLKNNLLVAPFAINTDRTPPLLEAFFDNRRISNYDLISPNVEISLVLKDENTAIPLDDPELISFFIIAPDQSILRYSIDDPRLIFTPSSQTDNGEAILRLSADFAESGIYTLVATAEDKSGNKSGEAQYEVVFEVDLEQALSSMVNYPNPFSTSTRFLYTLSGSETIMDYKIVLSDVSGRVVNELDHMQLGPLQVGTHLTDGAWDGTDLYGDKLANGVYLYRVITTDIKHRAGETDAFVDKGWNKLTILR